MQCHSSMIFLLLWSYVYSIYDAEGSKNKEKQQARKTRFWPNKVSTLRTLTCGFILKYNSNIFYLYKRYTTS
jgi:hypothetical protein